MKKIILCMFLVILLVGCSKKDEKGVLKELEKNIDSSNSYSLTGVLEMQNNETTYTYDVEVSYEKENKFRVSLKNTTNDHQQIILRNEEGVYVITPSLNKSFKFQSDWPYNNSQAYLLQTILKDIKTDEERSFKTTDEGYLFTTSVNYSNNKDLVEQKIYVDKNYKITKVEVYDKNGIAQIKMSFDKIDFKSKYGNNYFALESNTLKTSNSKTTLKIDDIIYPMYLPINTTLTAQNKVSKENGERVILTFEGDSPFTFIQETISIPEEPEIIVMNGEPMFLYDTVVALTDKSVNWISDGIEYYLVSDSLEEIELIKIAASINSLPVIK